MQSSKLFPLDLQDSMSEFKFRENYEVKSVFFSSLTGTTFHSLWPLYSSIFYTSKYFLFLNCIFLETASLLFLLYQFQWGSHSGITLYYPIRPTKISAIPTKHGWNRCICTESSPGPVPIHFTLFPWQINHQYNKNLLTLEQTHPLQKWH